MDSSHRPRVAKKINNQSSAWRAGLPESWPLGFQYALGLLVVAAVVGGRWLLEPLLGPRLVFLPVTAVLLPLLVLVRPAPFFIAALVGWAGSWLLLSPADGPGLSPASQSAMGYTILGALVAAVVAAWLSQRALTFRRKVLIDLQEGEARMRATFDRAAVGIAHLTIDGHWLQFNDCLCEILDQSRAELERKSFLELTDSSDHEEDLAEAQRLITGEASSFSRERRILRKDGSHAHVLLTVSLVHGADRAPLYFVAVVSDLSVQKVAEAQREAALAAEQDARLKLQAALASMSDAVFISDAQGNFIEFNEAFATFHRFPDKNACLTVLADYPGILEVTFDGSVAPMDAWAIPRALRGEAASNLEFGIRRTDTGEAWVGSYSFAPIRDPGGAIVGAVVAARDVTDHKRRELNAVFLARIGKDFARLKSPESIIRSLGKRISNYLDVAAVSYCSVNHRGDHVEAHLTWHKDDPSGRRPVPDSDCLTGEFARASRAGESFVVSDAAHDPRVNNAACARQGIGSFVTVPFHSRGQWKAFLAISGDAPRAWLPHELELVAEIAQRVFPRLQRAEAEDALRRSEEKYRTLYSKIDEGFCIIEMIFDADGVPSDYRFIEVNPAFEKQAGLVNVHGRRMRELAPDHDQHWFEVYGKVALTGESIRYQNHSRTLHRYFDVYAFRIGPPHAHQVAVLFSDISQRIRAEEELRASEHRLGLALDAAHAAAWEVDLASGVLFGDFRFNRLLQIAQSTSTEVPQRWLELVLPEDRERAAAEFAAACEEGAAPYDSEFRALRMDGVQRWYHSRGIVEREPSGSRMLGVIQDITEHKHAEDALREADRRKDEFLAILSHELRNPLAPIRTGVHLLKLAYDEPTTRNLVPMLERQVDHLTRLLDDLLNVSRIIRGQIDLRIQLIDLAAAIRIAVEATSPMIRAMGHELVLNLPNSPVMLHADPDRLAQMFSNFLHNAAKYMPTAGRIDLGVTRQDDHVFVSVRDQGIGLTAASITSVFDLFFQVGVAEGKIQDGLGIGLSLVKRLAELHGGHVVAHSEGPGRGSEFLVQLPVITTTHH